MTIRIEPQRNVAVYKVCAQNLQLLRRKIVDKRGRIRREALRGQKCVSGPWSDQRIAVVESALEVVSDLRRDWNSGGVGERLSLPLWQYRASG